jgi:hypothetical protein
MRVCVACNRQVRNHDKYVVLGLKTYKHRNCATPKEYDWRYLESTTTISNTTWQRWICTGLDPEACGGV